MFSVSIPFNVTWITRRLRRHVSEGGNFTTYLKHAQVLIYFVSNTVMSRNSTGCVIKGETYISVLVCTTIQEG